MNRQNFQGQASKDDNVFGLTALSEVWKNNCCCPVKLTANNANTPTTISENPVVVSDSRKQPRVSGPRVAKNTDRVKWTGVAIVNDSSQATSERDPRSPPQGPARSAATSASQAAGGSTAPGNAASPAVGAAGGDGRAEDSAPDAEGVPGWTEEQLLQLRAALQEHPLRASGDADAAFWDRMELVARRLHGRTALDCAYATRRLAATRAGSLESYYATAFYR